MGPKNHSSRRSQCGSAQSPEINRWASGVASAPYNFNEGRQSRLRIVGLHACLQQTHTRQPILPPVLRKFMEPGRCRNARSRSCRHGTKHKEAGEETDEVILFRREQPVPARQISRNSSGNETATYTSPLESCSGTSSEVYVMFDRVLEIRCAWTPRMASSYIWRGNARLKSSLPTKGILCSRRDTPVLSYSRVTN